MQYAESSRYAEWTCTNPPCQGHSDIPLQWLEEERVIVRVTESDRALRAENERLTQRLSNSEAAQTGLRVDRQNLEHENERLRAALTEIMAMSEPAGYGERSKAQIRDVARRALCAQA